MEICLFMWVYLFLGENQTVLHLADKILIVLESFFPQISALVCSNLEYDVKERFLFLYIFIEFFSGTAIIYLWKDSPQCMLTLFRA